MRFARILVAGVLSTGLIASGATISTAAPTERADATAERSAVLALDAPSDETSKAKPKRPSRAAYKPRKRQFIVRWPTYAGLNAKLQLSKVGSKRGFRTVAVQRADRNGRNVFRLRDSYYPPGLGTNWYLRVQARETVKYRLTNVCCVRTFKRTT